MLIKEIILLDLMHIVSKIFRRLPARKKDTMIKLKSKRNISSKTDPLKSSIKLLKKNIFKFENILNIYNY